MEARFWINRGADNEIRIKLRPGMIAAWEQGGPNDEGYGIEGESYRHDGDHVTRQWWSDGRDCDGRMSSGGDDACRLDRLDAHRYEWEGSQHTAPAWVPEDVYQRDYSAEAAGY